MNRENLMDAIGQLPEEMIGEVAQKRMKKKIPWTRWAALAACLCLVLTLPLVVGGGMKAANKPEMEAPMEMAPAIENILDDFFYAGTADRENGSDKKVESAHFLAHVVEIQEGSLLVEPLEEEWERSSADRIDVTVPNPQDPQ